MNRETRRLRSVPLLAALLAALGCSALIDLSDVNDDGAGGSGAGAAEAGSGGDGAGQGGDSGAAGSSAGEGGAPPDACSPNPCENDGECSAVGAGFECTCAEPYDGELCEVTNARTCLDWRRLGATEDGVYRVDRDGADGDDPFDVYCDMTSDGGGWTLVASQTIDTGFTEQWGTTALNPESPAIDALYVLDFQNRLPEPGEVRMRHEDSGGAFTHTILRDGRRMDAGWQPLSGATALRRRVVRNSDAWWLIFSRGVAGTLYHDYFCVNNALHPPGYTCDGNVGQSDGQGLLSPLAADEITACPVGSAIWKEAAGPPAGVRCNPEGFVTAWFREPLESCAELRELGVVKDGPYAIDPDGDGPDPSQSAFNVYCDMTTRGGGWTLVAINGLSGRPATFYENNYPRPGASFYSTIEGALADLPSVRSGLAMTGTAPIAQYSVNARELYTRSSREFLAYVGGTTTDYVYGTLPAGCNFFDGATICAEDSLGFFEVFRSDDSLLTDRAQACTTANREPPFEADGLDEFGLHVLAGTEKNTALHCHSTMDTLGPQNLGRVYSTFNNAGTAQYWSFGVHEHWNEAGALNQPGYLMIR